MKKKMSKKMINGKSILTRTVNSDTLTPVAALLKLEGVSEYLCLLESVTGGENKGRYSAIALLPKKIWKFEAGKVYFSQNAGKKFSKVKTTDPISSLRDFVNDNHISDLCGLPSIAAGVFGYMGYDMIRLFENIPDKNPANIDIPDSVYFLPEIVLL
ncbi:MAG TPA: anthranilate synthase component I, partial [Alphaproteobacteria bacterium]|nr:anthranilate synthase component I [Alphaproteobacteria bacterium]